jgi:hypothetical protein
MNRVDLAMLWIAYWTWVLSLSGLLIWLGKQVKAKIHKKAQPVQPQIEVYGKNYKKINTSGKVFNKTI